MAAASTLADDIAPAIPAGTPDLKRQIASLPLPVVLLGPGQRIAAVNPAGEQFFGQGRRRLIGRPLTEALRFDEVRVAERLGDDETPLSARQVAATIPGIGRRTVDVIVAPVADSPGWQIMTLNDSSAAEALGEAAAGGDFGTLRAPEVLAHEIKNPLAGIRGAAQLLARKLDERDQTLTTLIADEVDRIAKLIDQMQTLSRRMAEPIAPCNLHEAVRRAIAVLTAASESGARIEEEFDPSLPAVLGSSHSLVQVLINLIANAREACRDQPQPRVIVRTRFVSGLQLHAAGKAGPLRLPIELRISDNGPGIDPAMREHIFEPFVTSKKSGQGLGLALVRKLVRDMNGRVTHDRDEAAGLTHFRVHLAMAPDGRDKRQRS